MSNDSKRVSQLGVTTTVSNTDRVVVLTNPGATSANLQTITVNNFSRFVSNTGSYTFSGNVMSSSNADMYIRGPNTKFVNIISDTIVQLQVNPNNQVAADIAASSNWVYVTPNEIGLECIDANAVHTSGLYLSTNGVITLSGNVSFDTTNSYYLNFSDNTSQNTAFQKVTAPATSGSNGSAGQIAWDSNYIYICTSTNTWKRVALNLTSW
jgi:hypothetical protein